MQCACHTVGKQTSLNSLQVCETPCFLMVEFLKEAEDAIRSFHATQAGACTQSLTDKVMLDILREKQARTDP